MDRGKLFEDNQGLVFHIWRKKIREKTPNGLVRNNEDDIIQEGLLGLWQAAERFDETRGTAFSTYATHYIEGYMKRYIAEETGIRRKEQPEIVSLDVQSGDTSWVECIPAPETEDVTWILESDQLNDFQKAVARMTYKGYSQREIGEVLGKSRTTVGTTLKEIGKILNK